MGGYLSEPIKDKESADFESDRLLCGASSMQGWRENQEDAHNCCLDYDENVSLFAVYDGHGGQEVAQYCEKNLPDFIKNTEAYKKGDYENALIDGFLGFDATIITPEVIKVLEQMSGRKLEGSDVEDESEENVKDLFLEAKMPLDQLVAKYRQEGAKIKFDSPMIKPRKNDGAGPSSSKSGDGDISSSSAQVGFSKSEPSSSTSSDLTNGEVLVNGDVNAKHDSADKAECGSSGMCSKSPAKQKPGAEESGAGSSSKPEVASSSKAEVASSSKAEVTSSLKSDEPDSSSGEPSNASKAEVSSTNGGVEEQNHAPGAAGDISSSSSDDKPAKRNLSLTRKLLMNMDDSDSDSDDVDFEGEPPSDEEDDDEGDSVAVEVDDDEEEEEEDEGEEEEEEEEEEDEDEDCDGRFSVLPEEPGMDSGCTAVVALLTGNNLFVANAGDSRCIVCRTGTAVEMSIDHKPEDTPEMERILAAGGTVKEGRVNKGLNLSRAIGDFTYKKNEALPPTEQMIIALPDVKKLEIDPTRDEFMVLACDGIWNSMTSQEVVDFVKPKLQEGLAISKICEQLFDHCLAPNTLGDGTGCDNMTCIIVKFKDSKLNSVGSQEPVKRAASPDVDEADRAKRQKTEEEPAAITAEAASA